MKNREISGIIPDVFREHWQNEFNISAFFTVQQTAIDKTFAIRVELICLHAKKVPDLLDLSGIHLTNGVQHRLILLGEF